MEASPLTRFERVTLKAIITVQIIHTVFWIVGGTPDEFVQYVVSPGKPRHEMVPLIEAFSSGYLLTRLLALSIEILILRRIYRLKSRVWCLLFILLFDASLYILWYLQFHIPVTYFVGLPILFAIPIGFFALWRSRTAHSIGGKHLFQVSAALLLAALVVYFDGLYFRLEPQWGVPLPPLYYRIITCGRFSNHQESSLVLCWSCYALVSACLWLVARIKNRLS